MFNYGQTSVNDPLIRQNAIQNLFMQLLSQDDETLNNLNIGGVPTPGVVDRNPFVGMLDPGVSPTMPGRIPTNPYDPTSVDNYQLPAPNRGPNPYRAPSPFNRPQPQVARPTVSNIPRLMPTRADVIRFGGIF